MCTRLLIRPGGRYWRAEGLLGAAIFVLTVGVASAQPALQLTLTAEDLEPNGPGRFLADGLAPPDPGGLAVVDPNDTDPVFGVLRRLSETGEAQGFSGIVYENRDRGHSQFRHTDFPALTWLTYSDELRKRRLDFGLAGSVRTNLVTFGNSSTAITSGHATRSLVRRAMTHSGQPELMFETYSNNQIYVYPEHRDHDEVDNYPANWPYTITSQGSSRSDQLFLRAIALTLASFRPETFERLRDTNLIAPTVQMILRRELGPVIGEEHYFTGRAHPVVFQRGDLRPGRMVARAAALAPDEIPPMVRIRVEDEDFADAAGLAGLSEKLFDTPSAVARIWRDTTGRKSMTVSAAETVDPNDRDLTFSWHVLSGDAAKVKIEPLDENGRRARLTFDWQDPRVLRGQGSKKEGRLTSRIDIGVFAQNGAEISAPAFISVDIPAHQIRVYEDQGSAAPKLTSIDYDAAGRGVYYDPLLFWSAPWTDRVTDGVLERRSTGEDQFVPADSDYEIDRSKRKRPKLKLRD